jgi:hypothetical protein
MEKPGPWVLVLKEVDTTVGISTGFIQRLYLYGPTWWGIAVWVAAVIAIHVRRRGLGLRSWLVALGLAAMVTLLRILVAIA